MGLGSERCEACRPGSPLVSADEERELSRQIPDWEIVEIREIRRLRRVFRLKDWTRAVEFAVAVARIAEVDDHHPSLLVEWGTVTVTWWTHAIKGLHRNDFIMAAKTDGAFPKT